jgi:regulator of RNase E activity RraA
MDRRNSSRPHQLAISCGGVAVNPGDLIVGDGDGVVVVRREKG